MFLSRLPDVNSLAGTFLPMSFESIHLNLHTSVIEIRTCFYCFRHNFVLDLPSIEINIISIASQQLSNVFEITAFQLGSSIPSHI